MTQIIEVTDKRVAFKATVDTRGSINIPSNIRSAGKFDTGAKVVVTLELYEESLEECTSKVVMEG